MRQFILPETFHGQHNMELLDENFHYICNVIRKKVGDSFPGLDRNGNKWLLTIIEISKESCNLQIDKIESHNNTKVEVTLVQCLPLGKHCTRVTSTFVLL